MKRNIFRKWWVWVLALLVLGRFIGGGAARSRRQTQTQSVTATAAATSAPTTAPTAAPTAAPTIAHTATATPPGPGPDDIRPEVREFLDSYEACMDEYVEFMQKYMKADPNEMMKMMGDYYSILARYTEFTEKLERLDESQLTNAAGILHRGHRTGQPKAAERHRLTGRETGLRLHGAGGLLL